MWLAFAFSSLASERFDDIVVSPQSLVSGETFHGYSEYRVALENQSSRTAHTITLIYPDRAFGYGNSISRLSRTVSLGPASRAVVPFWQPPLPLNGNGNLRVEIDGETAGTVSFPSVPRHLGAYAPRYGNSQPPSTLLISQSLDYDEVSRVLKPPRVPYSADMATGRPDSGGRHGTVPSAWTPDTASAGPHWIELDYDKPVRANRLWLYETLGLPPGGEIILRGISGTNLARIPLPTASPRGRFPARRPGAVRELSFPLTAEPVKSVRLDFGLMPAGDISIDAVALGGLSRGQIWAAAARASSESHSRPGRLLAAGLGSQFPELLRPGLPVAEWSDHWLSYTPFDEIVLRGSDLASVPPGVTSALWRYVECGGNLVLFGGGSVPEPWGSSSASPLMGGKRFEVGLGQCFVFQDRNVAHLESADVKALTAAAAASARYWQSLPDENSANASFHVVKDVRVPVRSTVFVMLAFVILIGPVNLFVLSRLRRRIWLLWTVPAISLATCLMVFVYSFLREGVTPDVRTEGLTVLDQVTRRAASVGMTAFYCPLTPGQGLFFGFDTEATPLVERRDYRFRSRSGTPRSVDWTRTQHLDRGWVSARVPAHFLLRKSETCRERLQLETEGGRKSIINGLGARIRFLWLADDSGRVFTATNVPAGQRANLVPSKRALRVSRTSGPRGLLQNAGYAPSDSFIASGAENYLRPSTYIAELESDPFLENGLGPKAGSSRSRSRAVVYGILERSP